MRPANVQDQHDTLAFIAELQMAMPSLRKVGADRWYGGPKLAKALTGGAGHPGHRDHTD